MNGLNILLFALIGFFLSSCGSSDNHSRHLNDENDYSFEIENLSDENYPDNPDIGFRSENYHEDLFGHGKIIKASGDFNWNFTFLTKSSDSIELKNIDISELIPTIPEHVKSNQYLSYLSCVNQEWNRNQIRFNKSEFTSNMPSIVRVDLARNCLNAYLWEIIVYVSEKGTVLPYSHGWFSFPVDLYAELFESKNSIPFAVYQKPLEDWIDPESEEIELGTLRKVIDSVEIDFRDLSNTMYPVKAARKKKYKEIIRPASFRTMKDLQSDSTQFATFSPPGFYDKRNPRKTELGRIHTLQDIQIFEVKTPPSEEILHELVLKFTNRDGITTSLVFGGLNLSEFPVLDESECNEAWKNSMGIGNHTFYESYQDHIGRSTQHSSYYALILDQDGKWLDSHKIGIDGPIFHYTDEQRKRLHLWLLSFERHALVGHYAIDLKE